MAPKALDCRTEMLLWQTQSSPCRLIQNFPRSIWHNVYCLLAYEWPRAQGQIENQRMELAGTDWAAVQDVEKLAEHFEQRLDTAGFFFPETKTQGMKINLRNIVVPFAFDTGGCTNISWYVETNCKVERTR